MAKGSACVRRDSRCDGTTWKTITVGGTAKVTRCDCWHQQLYEGLLRNARIPRRYLHCELANFDTHTDSQRTAQAELTRSRADFERVIRELSADAVDEYVKQLEHECDEITVLSGGPSSEREVSLNSGRAIAAALQSIGASWVHVVPLRTKT